MTLKDCLKYLTNRYNDSFKLIGSHQVDTSDSEIEFEYFKYTYAIGDQTIEIVVSDDVVQYIDLIDNDNIVKTYDVDEQLDEFCSLYIDK